jgi:uncharacterized protein YcnI
MDPARAEGGDHMRRAVRSLVGVGVVVATVLMATGVAGAHVTVKPGTAEKGSFSVLSFSTPNERDDANTVALEVNLPTDHPIPFVSILPLPGWTHSVEKTKLAEPVETDDGTITEAVSKITWRATDAGLLPGEFQLFTVSAGPLPKTKQLVFKALQTYSSGEVVRWIEPRKKGAPEPETPAPVLKLTKPASDG